MTRLYLIRHAKPATAWGDSGGGDDPGLDETGRTQALAARDALLALAPAERPVRVVSSPLRRCRETAQPTAEALGVEVEIDPAVGEIPTPAGLAVEERPAWLRSAFEGLWRDIEGDRDYNVWRRSVAASLRARGGAAVFSHYVAINAVVTTLEDDERVIGLRPDHASIHVLETDGAVLTLVSKGRESATQVL
ncbi:MAG: histidine phosphatase family protein [Phenylobacterium sp.]|uniref:histidine phosphatase family protein n=1 Tax=Phenylobacterium sp. TaxID=1871053 RepID=UPI0027357034|nr:histidine phosphatase family protein [Phenylobacterium sp.]MDP3173208.1 histidine phosphatase family protein [Phenylobacterium sp.]